MEASSSKPRHSASTPSCTELELKLASSHKRGLRGLEHRWSMNARTWKQPDDKSNPSVSSSSKPAVNQARDVSTATTVRIKYKHPLAIRWMHWVNFPLLVVMIYSGLLIYWADSQYEGLNAHRVYRVGSVAGHSSGSFLRGSITLRPTRTGCPSANKRYRSKESRCSSKLRLGKHLTMLAANSLRFSFDGVAT